MVDPANIYATVGIGLRIFYTDILCITRTVEHNYISLSTVGIQVHVSAL